MASLNVYSPDELRRRATDAWLAALPTPRGTVSHQAAVDALDEVRTDLADVADASVLVDLFRRH
jgi:hypothetical protein